ncbi:MAG: deoxyribodipyrimidine photo-lyase, partial [Thermomicrobiales bacterium]
MVSLSETLESNPRITFLRKDGHLDNPACVLLWVQRTKRAHDNPARNVAIELANDLDLPLIAVFCLADDYPEATLRSYQFMTEGLDELADAFADQHIGWILETGNPAERISAVADSERAAIVVTDLDPMHSGRRWRNELTERLDVPFIQVDSDVVVPTSFLEKQEYAARTIRPKLQRHYEQFLSKEPEQRVRHTSHLRRGGSAVDAVAGLKIDMSVPPAPDLKGGYRQASKRLDLFIEQRFGVYDKARQRADIDAGTGLSPWLHFGQIGPVEIALAAIDTKGSQAAIDSFLDELIVQRELAINFTMFQPEYDKFSGLPEWARESLARHEDDPRPETYSRSQFEEAKTHDPLWNAAQRQMVQEGWMPNRLRMYWAKQILLWSSSAQRAWSTAIYLNNRYFVDGRDANSFTNVGWCIGGLHDRPFGPERPITGLVRPMGMGAMKRTFDVQAYIRKIDERWGNSSNQLPLFKENT